MKTHISRVLAQALLVFASCCSILVQAAAFTPGNIVVVRVDGSGFTPTPGLTAIAAPVFLDEYTPAGALVQSIALPTTASGSNKRLTLSGSATSEGYLSRSADGRYLVLGGYDADVSTASVTTSSPGTVNRVVARIGADGTVDTTTALTTTGGNFRGVASSDGTDMWVVSSTGGTHYTIHGATVSTQVASTPANARTVGIAGGNLFITSGSTGVRLLQVGTGLPTATGQTATNVPGDPTTTSTSPYGFFFADLDPSVPGLDTLYLADDGAGIRKYSLVSNSWVANGLVSSSGSRQLTGVVNGSTVTLFVSRDTTLDQITTIVDSTGYNATITATPTTIATIGANTMAFRGIALVPEQLSTPTNRTVTLSVSSTATSEGGAAVTITATTDGAVSGAKTVDLATSGTASAGDYTLSGTTITIADGASSGSVTLTPVDDSLAENSEVATLSLTNPSSGLTIGTPATASVTIADNDALSVTLSASASSGTESAGTVITLTATVPSAVSSDQTVDVLVAGTNVTATDYALSATTITIAAGQTTGTVTFTVANDADLEATETAAVSITNPSSGLVIGTPSSVNISIIDDDTPVTRIYEVQGARHYSAFHGQVVNNVPGIVTEVRSNGFFMQDEAGDGDVNTSDGIFVFTTSAPGVSVGSRVAVTGTVFEFRPDCTSGSNNLSCTNDNQYNLTATQIGFTGGVPSVLTTAVGPFTLPSPVVMGAGGRPLPLTRVAPQCAGANIETNSCTFDAAGNAIDYFESLEGMRVRVNDPMAVSGQVEFDEFWVVADGGNNSTGISGRGTNTIAANDAASERILLNLTGTGAGANLADLRSGDRWTGAFDGILNYSFGDYKVDLASGFVMPAPTTRHGLGKEVTTLVGTTDGVTIGSYNVENLAGTSAQSKFDELAAQIVTNLKAPDVLALMEVQDNDGTSGGCGSNVVSASTTYSRLIAAISAANGPSYQVVQIDPGVCTDGGAQAGNIRVAFLYNPARVGFTPVAGGGTNVATAITNVNGEPRLQHNPGRIDPTNSAFEQSRKPLAAEFTFNGRRFIAIANHWNSKGGDYPEHGKIQPPTEVTQPQRIAISNVVKGFVQSALNIDPQAKIVVVGDLNDFPWSTPVTNLLATTPALTPLSNLLLTNERYTYVFRGNGQVLDYIIVSPGLAQGAEYDIVHVNAEYAVQVSDHEPEVARLQLPAIVVEPPRTVTVSKSGNGTGTVVSSPAGVDCGSTCSAGFDFNSTVTLTATPASDSTFVGWSGACTGTGTCTLAMSENRAVTAQFTKLTYVLTVSVAGPGTVTSSPAGVVNCGETSGTCSAAFDAGTAVTLTMTEGLGSVGAWGGACSGTGQCVVTMSSNRNVSATFTFPMPVTAVPVPQDANGDGRSDVVYRNASTGQVYRFLANGLALSGGAYVYTEPNLAWDIVGDGDFDRNGASDLLYRNATTGQVAMVRFGSGGTVIGADVFYNEPSPNWRIVQTPDIDRDGKSDIVWWNSVTGDVYVMLMNGTTIKAASLVYREANTQWRIVASGDFNGSVKQDRLVWRNIATGEVYLQQITYANGVFSVTGSPIYAEPNLDWRIVAAADFNGDDKTDLLYRNAVTGQMWMLLMDNTVASGGPVLHTEADAAWVIVATGDYNGDGKSDLLWRNSSTGQVYMMLMDGRTIGTRGFVHAEPDTAWELMGPGSY